MNAWLVRIALDLRQRSCNNDLRDVVALHRRVMSLVPNDLGDHARHRGGVLFRLDHSRTGPTLLAQSCIPPHLTRLPDGYGEVAIRDIGPLLKALEPGMRVRYRIAANASKRVAVGDAAGKVVPLLGTAAEDWWHRKAHTSGLDLRTLTVQPEPAAVGRIKDVRHSITRFDGTAVITNADDVRTAILTGIGRGKSFGCGLLNLAPER
ncbi:type I-E CRISPR-associated protein Cas6/Cse3/CasE [Micromonospora sp. NPDC048898]|uniref:type I-E CRISPR-associated protein Cas6/Cse3/CasE n=1 Tax=Micromonospora sp. NPDC048898 TaxID=3364260 RepID=UPI0037138B32